MSLQRAEWQSRLTVKTSSYLFPPYFGLASPTDHFYELSWALMKFYGHFARDIAGWLICFFRLSLQGDLGLCCPWVELGFSGLTAPSSWENLFILPLFLPPFPPFSCIWWVTSQDCRYLRGRGGMLSSGWQIHVWEVRVTQRGFTKGEVLKVTQKAE